eukprot:gene2271-2445_t
MLCKKPSSLSQKVLTQIDEQNQKIEQVYERKVDLVLMHYDQIIYQKLSLQPEKKITKDQLLPLIQNQIKSSLSFCSSFETSKCSNFHIKTKECLISCYFDDNFSLTLISSKSEENPLSIQRLNTKLNDIVSDFQLILNGLQVSN